MTEPLGARKGIRTPTPLRTLGPEPSESANSTTLAFNCILYYNRYVLLNQSGKISRRKLHMKYLIKFLSLLTRVLNT